MDKAEAALDDWLVARVLERDADAARLLVQRHHRALMAHALRLSEVREDAEDAVQSAWGDIFASLDRLRDPRAFRAWAYRVVTGKVARTTRRTIAARRRDAALPAPLLPNTPLEAAEHGDLHAAIAALPPGQRAAIALFYLEGFSVAEVAVALAIPLGTAKTRLMTARASLRAYLEGDV